MKVVTLAIAFSGLLALGASPAAALSLDQIKRQLNAASATVEQDGAKRAGVRKVDRQRDALRRRISAIRAKLAHTERLRDEVKQLYPDGPPCLWSLLTCGPEDVRRIASSTNVKKRAAADLKRAQEDLKKQTAQVELDLRRLQAQAAKAEKCDRGAKNDRECAENF